MQKKLILTILLFFFYLCPALARTSIKAEVDRVAITQDQAITYKIIVTSFDKQLPAPQIPKFEGFTILSQAESSTFSFLKGGAKTIFVYAFILAPNREGKIKIGPVSIKIKEETLSTDSFEIEVSAAREKPKTPLKEKLPLPKSLPESTEPQITL
jgi:hypothetical protein